jgi:hypothetical protein
LATLSALRFPTAEGAIDDADSAGLRASAGEMRAALDELGDNL